MKRQNHFIGNELNLNESTEIKIDQPTIRSVSMQPNKISTYFSQDYDSSSDSEIKTSFKSLSYVPHTPIFVPYQPKQIVSNQASFASNGSQSYRSTQSAERSIRIQKIQFR